MNGDENFINFIKKELKNKEKCLEDIEKNKYEYVEDEYNDISSQLYGQIKVLKHIIEYIK